jgi:hypothetical protein
VENADMKMDKNEFFRQVMPQICSNLDIEKGLLNFLEYVQIFVPASKGVSQRV